MAITVKINNVDKEDLIVFPSLSITKQIGSRRSSCKFKTRKYGTRTFIPAFDDNVKVYDDSTLIFAGTILKVDEGVESNADGVIYDVECSSYEYEMDKDFASKTYEDESIFDIITDLLSSYAPDFDADNVDSTFNIEKIVFNQVPLSTCIQRLADIVQYDWYVDENKSIHFFSKYTNTAPYNLTDTSGNYVHKSLKRKIDGTKIVNTVKVRGGEYDEVSRYENIITVNGDNQKSFTIDYKMSGLRVWLDTGAGYVAQDVGQSFKDDFTSYDVLQSFQDRSIEFENSLADGDLIKYDGFRKARVFAIAQDPTSVASYGIIDKMIRDNSIQSNDIARKRATAELYTYAEELIEASFETYTSGLQPGMLINLTSTKRNCDNDLIIKTVTFTAITPFEFKYKVDCISTKTYDLIDILRKLLEPEPLDADENEVSEEIFADTAEITIQENHEVVSPQEDFADITIQESIEDNPFDPDTINWVYGYYFPTAHTDVNRMGKYNRDAVYK